MKKSFLLLAFVLLALQSVSACPSYGVEISTNASGENLFVGVIEEHRYYEFENGSIKYFSLDSRDIVVEVTNETVIISREKDSTTELTSFNWTKIIGEELLWLKNRSAVNLTDSDITSISSKGCCGYIAKSDDEWTLTAPNCAGEGLELVWKDISFNWLAVLLSFAPGLAFFVYYSRKNKNLWKSFFIGGLGWFISYIAGNIPKMAPISALGKGVIETTGYILYASIVTGVLEEGLRYLIVKKANNYIKPDKEHILSMGMGWGLMEAVVIYAGAVFTNIIMINYPVTLLELLPGAIERNSAVLLHLGYSYMILKSLKSKKYLFLAIAGHALVDFFAVVLLMPIGDAWIIEGIIFVISVAVLLFGRKIAKEKKVE